MSPEVQHIQARWLFTHPAKPPLEQAILKIEESRIADVTTSDQKNDIDASFDVIIPGLINAHCHLELSDLSKPIERGANFTAWIRSVIRHRQQRQTTDEQAVQRGLRESRQQGIIAIADITQSASQVPGVIPFREIICFNNDEQEINTRLQTCQRDIDASVNAGISPHAPYSVSPMAYEQAIRLAEHKRIPVATHLAETREELEFLSHQTGPFREMLEQFGLWRPGILHEPRTPQDYLRPLANVPSGLIVHGNYLEEASIDFLATQPHLSVVYCPRTHAYFGHAPHPWRKLLARGINVTLGTDSRASNPDLSIWNELKFLHTRHSGLNIADLLPLSTTNAAGALHIPELKGTLEKGDPATFTAINLGTAPSQTLSAESLFGRHSQPAGAMRDGTWLEP